MRQARLWGVFIANKLMDEIPNVNNLNGVPDFGHGLPSDSSEEEAVAADPEAVDMSGETKDVEVELPEDNVE